MHVLMAINAMGKRAAALDLDSRQRSLTRYLENRARWAERQGLDLLVPECRVVEPSNHDSRSQAEAQEQERFGSVLSDLSARYEYIVIDSPGANTHLSRLGHASADTIITPLNDSFVDLDLLAVIDPETYEILGPSCYSEMIWDSRKRRALADRVSIDWVLMRNRLSSLDAKNKRRVGEVLEKLAPRTGFRLAPGFGERVIYRELFPMGLTLLDLTHPGIDIPLTMSHVAARQELRDLLVTLKLPGLDIAAAPF